MTTLELQQSDAVTRTLDRVTAYSRRRRLQPYGCRVIRSSDLPTTIYFRLYYLLHRIPDVVDLETLRASSFDALLDIVAGRPQRTLREDSRLADW